MDIRFINVEHSMKFADVKSAEREANRLKMSMYRFSQKEQIPFIAMICVSDISLKFGEAVHFYNGKKGRPKKKLVSKRRAFTTPEKVAPHLHIIVGCRSRQKEISEKFASIITNKYGMGAGKAYDITNTNPLNFFQYIARQSRSVRYITDYSNIIDLDFRKIYRLSVKQQDEKEGIYFNNLYRKDSYREEAQSQIYGCEN